MSKPSKASRRTAWTIQWTTSDGHKHSVKVTEYITACYLFDALNASPIVRDVSRISQ